MGVRQQTFMDYDGFLEKFKPKKTTDDCYTPKNVYEAVKTWAVEEYSLQGREVVRPFWPGAEFDTLDYPDNCVVIDNPPFSILAKIVRWYRNRKIDFFLFAPALTVGSSVAGAAGVVIPPTAAVTFENGAVVRIAFATNMGEYAIQVRTDLADAIAQASKGTRNRRGSNPQKTDNKLTLPDEVVTTARLLKLRADWRVKRGECVFVRRLDAAGKSRELFGGGYLLSERAAAERAAAERAAAERAAAERAAAETVWELSSRERAIIELLNRNGEGCERADAMGEVRDGE